MERCQHYNQGTPCKKPALDGHPAEFCLQHAVQDLEDADGTTMPEVKAVISHLLTRIEELEEKSDGHRNNIRHIANVAGVDLHE